MTTDETMVQDHPDERRPHFHRLLYVVVAQDPTAWREVTAALDAAMVDPDCDSYAPRCAFGGAAKRLDDPHGAAYHALRYMAAELWPQGSARQ